MKLTKALIDLFKFASKDCYRESLGRIAVKDGKAYATEGHMCARIPCEGGPIMIDETGVEDFFNMKNHDFKVPEEGTVESVGSTRGMFHPMDEKFPIEMIDGIYKRDGYEEPIYVNPIYLRRICKYAMKYGNPPKGQTYPAGLRIRIPTNRSKAIFIDVRLENGLAEFALMPMISASFEDGAE